MSARTALYAGSFDPVTNGHLDVVRNACRLVDILGLKDVLVPLNPGNVSAFGLLTVDVRNDYVQTHVSRHDRLEL